MSLPRVWMMLVNNNDIRNETKGFFRCKISVSFIDFLEDSITKRNILQFGEVNSNWIRVLLFFFIINFHRHEATDTAAHTQKKSIPMKFFNFVVCSVWRCIDVIQLYFMNLLLTPRRNDFIAQLKKIYSVVKHIPSP